MYVYLLNSNFETIAVLDKFTDFIWTDRYWECGDFEIAAAPIASVIAKLDDTVYIRFTDSEHLMILEYDNIHSDVELGDQILLRGRSLESMLDRRVVWNSTDLTGSFQDGIEQLLNENVIAPTITDRTIPDFIFTASTNPSILALGIDYQFHGENLLDLMTALCKTKNIGFRITLSEANEFEFQLYSGANRSFAQTTNNYVIFSPAYDNLLNSDYTRTNQFLKTVVLVGGEEGIGNIKATLPVSALTGGEAGLDRREMYIDSGITRNTSEGELTEEEYLIRLTNKGLDELAINTAVELFEGEASPIHFEFGVDYFMGDILQVEDLYNHRTKCRITEMIYSQNLGGYKIFPTFSKLAHAWVLVSEDVATGAIVIDAPTLAQ